MKLSTNPDYLHGYIDQVQQYAKAEKTPQMVYVLVDIGNSGRVKKLIKQNEIDITEEKWIRNVVIIDSTERKSASKR